jgi:uncharacterized membrane protein YeaQ/YmgE (transglycosylase-associated protein family)
LIWLLIGIVGGWLACRLTRRVLSRDYVLNILVGVIGAVVAGFVTNLVIFRPVFDPNLQSAIVSAFGAALFLIVFNAIRREPDEGAVG